MRSASRAGVAMGSMVGLAMLSAAACGRDGGELRDATRSREAMQQAAMDSLRRDSAAAAQAGTADTAGAIPVFADVPPDSAPAAAAPGAAPAAPADTTAQAPPPAPAPAPPADAPGEWTSSVREARRPGVSGTVTALRAARNEGFDRVTLQFDGARVPGYHLEYVRAPATQCGSGQATPVEGRGVLLLRISSARAHDEAGRATVAARDQKTGLPVIRQVAMTCDFEGVVELAIGVSTANRYRVVELANPTRLAVDVQQ
jgi:hypothetical protein